MVIERKLQEMGLELPKKRVPAGVYVMTKQVGNLVFVAGQTADVNGIPEVKGVVGKDLTIEEGRRGARISALNILSVLKEELGDLDRVKQFVQIISYVRCADDFGEYSKVIDAASELFQELFGDVGLGVRMAIGTNELPGGSATEIMAVVEVKE